MPNMAPTTPTRSPFKRAGRMKAAQKQALIDNLQLELTERARKLRAQMSSQSHYVKSRILLRVNRIPVAQRKRIMGDLWAKTQPKQQPGASSIAVVEKAQKEKFKISTPGKEKMKMSTPGKEKTKIPTPGKKTPQRKTPQTTIRAEELQRAARASPSPVRPARRVDSDIEMLDQENDTIDNPKRRNKAGRPPISHKPTLSSNPNPLQVLSAKSSNSRTLPQSPIRPTSPTKSSFAKVTTKVTRGTKITPASSTGSGAGAAPAPVKKAAAPKKTVMSTIRGIGGAKKTAAAATAAAQAKTTTAAAPAAGRVLRKRAAKN